MLYKRNITALEWKTTGPGGRFEAKRKGLTPQDQEFAPKIGLSLYRLEPGKSAFPFHHHSANDEAILILRGHGQIRYGDENHALSEGDYIYLPAASGRGHQVVNSGDGPLEYYCWSSMIQPEVCFYPDSGKLSTILTAPSADGGKPQRRVTAYPDAPTGYWEGES